MLIFQFVGVEVFSVAFIVSAFSHDWAFGSVVAAILLYLIFWVSDFYSLPPEAAVYYHLWNWFIILSASLAGHIYSKAFRIRPLVRISYGDITEKKISLPAGDVVVALFTFGVLGVAAGINLWALRTNIGLSPIGGVYETAGIALAILAGLLLIIMTGILLVLDVRARLAAKYLWMLTWWLLPYMLTDFGFYKYAWGEPGPEFAGAALLVVSTVFNCVFAIYVPIRKKNENLEGEDHGISFDPLYRNTNYAFGYIGGMGLTMLVAILAFTFIVSWWDRSLEDGAIVLIVVAAASILVSFILMGFSGQAIENLKNEEAFVELTDYREETPGAVNNRAKAKFDMISQSWQTKK